MLDCKMCKYTIAECDFKKEILAALNSICTYVPLKAAHQIEDIISDHTDTFPDFVKEDY